MGDRGTYASGNNVAYKFETVDLFEGVNSALFHILCKHGKWHKIQNGNRAGKSQGGLPPVIAY